MIDCRWLGLGGAGRASELLLRGLADLQPEGNFVLWGPDGARRHLWSSATHAPSVYPPTSKWGQAEIRRLPPHDISLYMHQVRPLRPGPSITVIYDTIPLRHGANVAARTIKRAYLHLIGGLSTQIATMSHYSAGCIHRDLRVPKEKISVIGFPVDQEMSERVAALRQSNPVENVLLFVGRFGAHKNLPRLIDAFPLTAIGREGGRLLLVGGSPSEIEQLRALVAATKGDIEMRPPCSQADLEFLYATSRMLVMPSLEEGYGLPALEAIVSGLRICLSDIPVFRELFADAPRFDPMDPRRIAGVIDESIDLPSVAPTDRPSPRAYASDFVAALTGMR